MTYYKKLATLFIVLFVASCSKETAGPSTNCRLEKINASNGFIETYSFNEGGQLIQQIRKGSISTDTSVYTYNASGKIDKIVEAGIALEFLYSSDGKLASTSEKDAKSLALKSTVTYFWYADSVIAVFQNAGAVTPYQIEKTHLQGENISKQTYYEYIGGNLASASTKEYSNYDVGLNPYYVADLKRPGFPNFSSKNNPGKCVETTIIYSGGVAGSPNIYTVNYTYTYDKNNMTISETDNDGSSNQTHYDYSYSCG
jgi:hypothetical protein